MADKITVPDIGDYEDVPVIEVLVAEGDMVEAEQPLIVLESDKATMEVPAPEAGRIGTLHVKVDDRVKQGDAICDFEPATGTETPKDDDAQPQQQPQAGPDDAEAAPEEPKVEKSQSAEAQSAEAQAPAAAAAKGASEGGTMTVTVPDIGDFTGVPVIEVLVAEGDVVEAEQPLIVLESDKATMEVPAPQAGTIGAVHLKVDDKVSQGDKVCELRTTAGPASAEAREEGGTAAASQASTSAEEAQRTGAAASRGPSPASGDAKSPEPAEAQGERMHPSAEPGLMPHAGPAVRRLARELGVDLAQVRGSGRKGRILREDVQQYVKTAMQTAPAAGGGGAAGLPAQPQVDFAAFGEVEERPLARIRKLSAQNLHRNWLLVPHVTQTDDADITALEAFRKQASSESGTKLTLLPFLIKAAGAALKAFPDFNSSLSADGESLVLKHYCHIGFAADTKNGLLVPVVRDVWLKSVTQIAEECSELAAKARDGKLKPDEMKGGCFSISSLGGIGGGHFSPIINAPEVAILGVSRARMQPVWDGADFSPRLMCPLSLSYDHRVIDGAAAARFIVYYKSLLEDLRRLLL